MEENIKQYYEHAQFNLKEEDRAAIENIIDGYRELEKNHINPSKARISYYDTKKGTQVVIEGFIPKSILRHKRQELEYDQLENPKNIYEDRIKIEFIDELMEDKQNDIQRI